MSNHILDLNTVESPALSLVMRDEARTTLTVELPTESLIQELQANLPKLQETFKHGDLSSINLLYNLAAKLISCNSEGVAVTADDLRGQYNMGFHVMFAFFASYLEMINGVESEKN